jgi:pimeloyl-ACP methyl ester carboxylesterase
MINEPPAIDAAPPTPLDVKLHTLWTTEPRWTTADLSKITCPALITAGDHDLVRTEHTVALQKAIPHAELAILPGSGHSVPHDDAPHWDEMVLRFLTKPAPPPRAK